MLFFQSLFKKVFRRSEREGEHLSIEVMKRTKDEMTTLGKAVENVFKAMHGLEELNFCSKCGDLFLCRYKTCPQCGEPNPKYKEFTNKDQQQAEIKLSATVKEFHGVRKAM